jgi:nucleoside-diphosphate-sugar epimerase
MPRAVVTGGAGFLGSHLCDVLRDRDWEVVAVDNLVTGQRENVAHRSDDPGFTLIEHDVIQGIPVDGPVDAVLHLASPASPPEYLALPIATLEVGSIGTRHALDLARANDARFLLASTSEIYGDPLVHPQPETYFGNVNSVGPRSVYDEAKRYAEAITMAYHREFGVDTKIVRIFNTYGPRLLESEHVGPMNIGNPGEFTMLELAEIVREITGAVSEIVFEPLPVDDPKQRRPDISLAERVLGWRPRVDLREGLARTYDWYRRLGGT